MATVTQQTVQAVFRWFTSLRATHPRNTMIVGLNELAEWQIAKHVMTFGTRKKLPTHTHQELTSDTTCASNVLWLTATRHRHARSCRHKDVC